MDILFVLSFAELLAYIFLWKQTCYFVFFVIIMCEYFVFKL